MKAIGAVAGALLGPVTGGLGFSLMGAALGATAGGVVDALKSSGGKQQPMTTAPLPQVTRDDASASDAAARALRSRRGSAADILTGTRGAEAGSGTTGKFVVGN